MTSLTAARIQMELSLGFHMIYPDLTAAGAAAPASTLALTAATLPIGFGVLVPSLWLLFAVFKRQSVRGNPSRGIRGARRA